MKKHSVAADGPPKKGASLYLALIKLLGLNFLLMENSPIDHSKQLKSGRLIAFVA